MNTMMISEFKAKCIRTVKNIRRTRQPLVITLRGVPVARVEPIRNQASSRILGRMKGSMKIKGDIVQSNFSDEWEMNG